MARADPRFTDVKYLGEEPLLTDINADNQTDVGRAFNWYNYFYNRKEAQEWVIDFLKHRHYSKDIIHRVKSYGNISMTACSLCRMEVRGTILDHRANEFILKEISKASAAEVEVAEEKKSIPRVSIQDRIKEKVGLVIGELEEHLDVIITNKSAPSIDVSRILKDSDLKALQGSMVSTHFKKYLDEVEEAMTTDDEQLIEAYGRYTKAELNKIVKFLTSIIEESTYHSKVSKAVRTPKVKKTKSAIQLVSKVKYLKTYAELNLTSVDPSQLVGATSAWVYNTKYRKLGNYQSIDQGGFSIKGTTLQDFNEMTSTSKTLRKPEQQIKELMSASKPKLKQFMGSITSTSNTLNGRLNEETVILRVVK